MTTTKNNEHKKLNFSSEREQSQACLNSAEHEKNQGRKVLNVPNLRFPEFQGEWEKNTLGDISEFSKDRLNSKELSCDNYVATENMLQDYQGIVAASKIPSSTNVIKFSKGDVLLSNIRPYLKKVWYADRDGGCSADVFVFKALSACIPDFLHYVIANDRFINFAMSGTKGVKMPRGDKEQMKTYEIGLPSIEEQKKIAKLLSLLDERITTQNKIIEDLKELKAAIIEIEYTPNTKTTSPIGDVIEQISKRNKNNAIKNVLSVSNRQGFIKQSDQFENRNIASEDTSNYKIVEQNDFAFNPARINVGSIARLTTFEKGIVSPMYICFRTQENVAPEYIDYFFESKHFYCEIQKRLEGSVRQCLSFEGLCNIPLSLPSFEMQQLIGKRLFTLGQKIRMETDLLELLNKQKQYLLRQMFI